jgi:hypothetical protein
MTLLELMEDADRAYIERSNGKRTLSGYFHPETGEVVEHPRSTDHFEPDGLAALIVCELSVAFKKGASAEINYRAVMTKLIETANLILAVMQGVR